MSNTIWLPLNEYALRSGTSISTLRRKIKNSAIEFKMEDGRYLICGDEIDFGDHKAAAYVSTDAAPPRLAASEFRNTDVAVAPIDSSRSSDTTLGLKTQLDETALRLRALEARLNGLVKKLDFFSEQNAELKMLVKIFEERLDGRV